MYLGDRDWGSVLKVYSAGHPLKCGGTEGVRGHTLNQIYETPGRGGGSRKTYKKNLKFKMISLNNFPSWGANLVGYLFTV